MSDDVLLDKIADDIRTIDEQITLVTNRQKLMQEAGEDTSKLETNLRTLSIKRDKWKRALESRGYTFK